MRGYATIVELLGGGDLHDFARGRAGTRADMLTMLEKAMAEDSLGVRIPLDIAGTIHRWWLQTIARDPDISPVSALSEEIDRGEGALERALRTALSTSRLAADVPVTTRGLRGLLDDVVIARYELSKMGSAYVSTFHSNMSD